jgi:hypothetical protein
MDNNPSICTTCEVGASNSPIALGGTAQELQNVGAAIVALALTIVLIRSLTELVRVSKS